MDELDWPFAPAFPEDRAATLRQWSPFNAIVFATGTLQLKRGTNVRCVTIDREQREHAGIVDRKNNASGD